MIIKGGHNTTGSAILKFNNDFDFGTVKRFYSIQIIDIQMIKAWQGHKHETKFLYVVKGEFQIGKVKINDWEQPSKELFVEKCMLSENKSEILRIEPGYANGIKALVPDSILIIYSDMSLEESEKDLIRFPPNYWSL